jgi:SPP1 family holin
MKKIIDKLKTLDKGTIIRTALLICALANQVIAIIGMTSFASEPLYQTITVIITVLVSALTAWKNNDYTHLAQLAGKVLLALRDGTLDEEEVNEILKKATENKETSTDETDSEIWEI